MIFAPGERYFNDFIQVKSPPFARRGGGGNLGQYIAGADPGPPEGGGGGAKIN